MPSAEGHAQQGLWAWRINARTRAWPQKAEEEAAKVYEEFVEAFEVEEKPKPPPARRTGSADVKAPPGRPSSLPDAGAAPGPHCPR